VQRGDAEHDLTALYAVRVDVLVDGPPVRGLLVAELEPVALAGLDEGGREVGVRGGGEEVEGGLGPLEDDVARAGPPTFTMPASRRWRKNSLRNSGQVPRVSGPLTGQAPASTMRSWWVSTAVIVSGVNRSSTR
jgi:hypothetical protein